MLHWFARRLKEVQEVPRDERGFTLIELLVVIIIIGILAAIAIPVFLSQRAKAQDAAAKSDLRNAASAQTVFYAENDAWATTVADLESQGFRKSDGVVFADANISVPGPGTTGAYCMDAASASGANFHIGEATGGVQDGVCA
jgi:prepilin-type N-terminal cleavage/methylation domain-containing protein